MLKNSFSSIRNGSGARFLRAGLILVLGWVALEAAFAKLVANSFGWGFTVALHSIKGGIGLILLGVIGGSALMRLARGSHKLSIHGISQTGFGLLSAVLIALPGLIPALIGLALYSPSMRVKCLAWFRPLRKSPPRQIELAPADYKELRARRPRKRLKAPQKTASSEGDA